MWVAEIQELCGKCCIEGAPACLGSSLSHRRVAAAVFVVSGVSDSGVQGAVEGFDLALHFHGVMLRSSVFVQVCASHCASVSGPGGQSVLWNARAFRQDSLMQYQAK